MALLRAPKSVRVLPRPQMRIITAVLTIMDIITHTATITRTTMTTRIIVTPTAIRRTASRATCMRALRAFARATPDQLWAPAAGSAA